MMNQRRLKANGVNEPSVICANVESGSSAGAVSASSGGPSASAVSSDLPRVIPPPPSAPPLPPSPPELPPDVPPAPPAPRWGNDIRQRHVSAQDEGLPPPPPPPAGVDTMRLHASYKNLFGPDPPDLVV